MNFLKNGDKMNPRNYVISQRISYLGMGSIVGYFIAQNEEPLSYYMIIGFVLFAIIISEYFRRKK